MLKYSRLTKEQFEELHQEFINFLATQTITAEEWETLKRDKPEAAEEELDIFSDLIWEGVLSNAKYLENISQQQLFLFKLKKNKMKLIVVKTINDSIDITTKDGYQWLQEHFTSDEVDFFTASKAFSKNRKSDIFSLIQQGATITKGELYSFFDKIIS